MKTWEREMEIIQFKITQKLFSLLQVNCQHVVNLKFASIDSKPAITVDDKLIFLDTTTFQNKQDQNHFLFVLI